MIVLFQAGADVMIFKNNFGSQLSNEMSILIQSAAFYVSRKIIVLLLLRKSPFFRRKFCEICQK
jgi:hypothetical protein